MEKRTFERIPTSIKVAFNCCNTEFFGIVRNCSESGMFISTKKMFFPFDSKIEVIIPFKKDTLKIPAAVSRSVKEGGDYSGIGVKLSAPTSQYLEFIDSLKWTPSKLTGAAVQDMKVFVCRECLHIAFYHAPVDCPVCGSSVEFFENDPGFVNHPSDPANLNEIERMHIPIITVSKDRRSVLKSGGVDIHTSVGEVEHVMGREDYIDFIDFYFDDININKRCLARVNLMCEKMQPSTSFHLNKLTSGAISIVAHCSTHGSWMAKADI
jgi:desulfoferrodoxin (superoxide reductase-like protein)